MAKRVLVKRVVFHQKPNILFLQETKCQELEEVLSGQYGVVSVWGGWLKLQRELQEACGQFGMQISESWFPLRLILSRFLWYWRILQLEGFDYKCV